MSQPTRDQFLETLMEEIIIRKSKTRAGSFRHNDVLEIFRQFIHSVEHFYVNVEFVPTVNTCKKLKIHCTKDQIYTLMGVKK